MKPTAALLYSELIFKTSRSGGKGGQNVNKVSTKVELNFYPEKSTLLTEDQKAILLVKWAPRLTNDGFIQIISQSERTQLGNKRIALQKFDQLLEQAFKPSVKRKATKVPKGVKEKRLLMKKRRSEIKQSRQRPE